MSNEKLPTAAKVLEIDYKDDVDFPHPNIAFNEELRRDFEEGDELIQRTDVEQLIKERLAEQEQRIENLTGFDRVNLNDAKARKQELQELLKEVED